MYPHLPQIISEVEIKKSDQLYIYPHLPNQRIPGKITDCETDMSLLYNRVFEKKVLSLSQKENIFFKSFYKPISQSVLSNKRLYLPNDMHFNAYGFHFLAELVTEWVVRNPKEVYRVHTLKCVEVRVFSSAPTFQFLWVHVFLEPYRVVNVGIALCLGLIR